MRRTKPSAKKRRRQGCTGHVSEVLTTKAQSRPLGLDWHRTVAGDNGVVSAANRSLLYELLESGYRLCIISFASSRKRQEQVLSGRRALQHVLGFSAPTSVVSSQAHNRQREPSFDYRRYDLKG